MSRKITTKEANEIVNILEIYSERDSAFLFALAHSMATKAKRKHLRERG